MVMAEMLETSPDGTILYQQLTSKYVEQACTVTYLTTFKSLTSVDLSEDPEALAEVNLITRAAIKDRISIVAIDKNSDKVVGVAINKIMVKSKPFFEQFQSVFKNPKSQQLLEFFFETDNLCDLFAHCKVTCMMEMLFLGTLPEYRKRGIAKMLSEMSLHLAEDLHKGTKPRPEVIYAIFTSKVSQKIGRELGFQVAKASSDMSVEYKFL